VRAPRCRWEHARGHAHSPSPVGKRARARQAPQCGCGHAHSLQLVGKWARAAESIGFGTLASRVRIIIVINYQVYGTSTLSYTAAASKRGISGSEVAPKRQASEPKCRWEGVGMLILQSGENDKPAKKEGIDVMRTMVGTLVGSSEALLHCPRCAECSRWHGIAAAVRGGFFHLGNNETHLHCTVVAMSDP
jgi:hypothetical protein